MSTSSSSAPQFLVKSVLQMAPDASTIKIFQLKVATMEHLWDKVGSVYGMTSAKAKASNLLLLTSHPSALK